MMETQIKPSLEENIDTIYELLYLPSLDNTMSELLSLYINAYNQTIEEYNNNPSEEKRKRIEILSGPINFVFKNFPDDDNQVPYPAVDIIKKNFGAQNLSQDKPLARTLKADIPSVFPEETNNYQMNGFSFAVIIIMFTIFLGIGLAVLLLFIQ